MATSSSAVMAQILDPLPPEQSGKVLCCYVNATSKIQVARITNIPNWYFERVVFPGQRLVFEAPIEGQMEIHTGMMASAILSDTIPCDRLIMSEPSSNEFNTDSVGTDPISTKSVVQTNNTKPLTVAGLASVE
ncbi:alr4308 [Nostoc sp. PCC 7120 = FACHB-418]|nr:alr4308 [Nostoc sp. PCC 7120 = FACHB-418]